jgi:hypothetical protein
LYALGAVGQPVSTQERNGVQSRCWWSLGKTRGIDEWMDRMGWKVLFLATDFFVVSLSTLRERRKNTFQSSTCLSK